MNVILYTSAFCDPCAATRAVMAQAASLVSAADIEERDVVRRADAAEADRITSTPTVIVRSAAGAEVFRAEGIPTLNQVLAALARAV